jgi:hypothetical protein
MSEFDENDVTIEHTRLVGGCGYLRLTHRPSGLFVDADLKSGAVIRTKNALMNDLRERVLSPMQDRSGERVGNSSAGVAPGALDGSGGRAVPVEVDYQSSHLPSREH